MKIFLVFLFSYVCAVQRSSISSGSLSGTDPTQLYQYQLRSVNLDSVYEARIPIYGRCPSGLSYILEDISASQVDTAKDTLVPGATDGGMIAKYNVLGCCQNDSIACLSKTGGELRGCCPTDSFCCKNEKDELQGCASHPRQCCGDVVCPTGYACCPRRGEQIKRDGRTLTGTTMCCPLPPGSDIDDRSTYCESIPYTGSLPSTSQSYAGCLVSYVSTLDFCPYYASTSVLVGNSSENWFADYPTPASVPAELKCSYNLSAVVAAIGTQPAPNLCWNYTIKCKADTECAYIDFNRVARIPQDTSRSANIFALVQNEIVYGCCPVGLDACVSYTPYDNLGVGPMPVNFGGCADPGAGETCCGNKICPAGTKCCETSTEVAVDTNTTLPLYPGHIVPNTTTVVKSYSCCPNELDCCTAYLRDPQNSAMRNRFYCGATYATRSCELNHWRSPQFYTLYQKQVYGLEP